MTGVLRLTGGAITLFLASCDSPPAPVAPPDAMQVAKAETARPADPVLAALYDRSCRSCHAAINTGAPLTGHAAAWAARRALRGDAGLLASAKAGFGAMPAMGQCPDCNDEQLRALTQFMAFVP